MKSKVFGGGEHVLSEMVSVWTAGVVVAAVVYVWAMLAEGRGAHLLRMFLVYDRNRGLESLKDEALTTEVDRDANDLGLVAHLGQAERRYAELDLRRERRNAPRRAVEDSPSTTSAA